jgi:transposase-like protein
MATTPGRGSSVKRQDEAAGDEAVQVVRDQVEELARRGAQQMLLSALEEEVNHYLQRDRYQRQAEFRGYRNGTSPRRLTLGSGTVPLAVPRVRDIPPGQAPFESQILRKYQRRSDTIDETFMRLFIEGLATRDFEPALRLLAGAAAPLSPSTISRLTQQFRTAYTTFDRQDLSPWKFVYVWADGIYLKAGLGTEKACLMVLIGADTAGQKHLIALREGYRESAESWGGLLKDCRQRGLNEPACWIADGALGLWAAVNEQSPRSAQQRCTNHKTMNVIDKLPKAEQPEATTRVRAIWQAESEPAARKLAAALLTALTSLSGMRSSERPEKSSSMASRPSLRITSWTAWWPTVGPCGQPTADHNTGDGRPKDMVTPRSGNPMSTRRSQPGTRRPTPRPGRSSNGKSRGTRRKTGPPRQRIRTRTFPAWPADWNWPHTMACSRS